MFKNLEDRKIFSDFPFTNVFAHATGDVPSTTHCPHGLLAYLKRSSEHLYYILYYPQTIFTWKSSH